MKVATSTMNSLILSHSLRVQSEYNQTLIQQSSGLKSPTLSGLNGAAGYSVSLKSDLKMSEHLVGQAQTAQSAVDVSYGAISGIVDLIETAKTDIAAAMNGTVETTNGLKTKSEGWLRDTVGLLNTDIGGAHVFGGAGGTIPPVDLDDPSYNPLATPSVTDTGYYQGASAAQTIMVDGSQGLTYGVIADAEGFEATLRAFSMLSDMATDPPDTALLQEAYALLDEAVSDLGRMQEELSGQSESLAALIDRETGFQLFVDSALESVDNVDLAEAAAKASELEVVLEASYAALASIVSVSLVDYLR